MIRILRILGVMLLLSSCASKYKVDSLETSGIDLNYGKSFYVMLPGDGRYGATNYPSSGRMTQDFLYSALVGRGFETQRAMKIEDLEVAIKNAKDNGIDFLYRTTILNWEDRATEWSGITDKITMRYEIYSVNTNKVLASSTLRASSKCMTMGEITHKIYFWDN